MARRVRGFARWRLAFKYAGRIEILMGSITVSGLGVVVRMWPDLLGEDAARAVEMMIDNARGDGDAARAEGLAVIRTFLRDARSHGIDAAVAAVPPVGPLPAQDQASGAEGRPLDLDDPEDALELGWQLTRSEIASVDPDFMATALASLERLPPDLRWAFDRFTEELIAFQHSGDDRTLDLVIDTGCALLDDPRLATMAPYVGSSLTADLAAMLVARFERAGRTEDLADGIRRIRAGLEAMSDDAPDRPTLLNNIAVMLRYQAAAGGDPAELDEAITHLEHAENLPTANVPQVRHSLGLALLERFARTGDLDLLERAVRLFEAALAALRPGSPLAAPLHQARGIGLMERFLRSSRLPDLNASVDSFQEAVDAAPLHLPARAAFLEGLGNAVRMRGELTGSADDLRAAGDLLEEAIDLLPDDGYRAQTVLGNIAQAQRAIYLSTGEPTWLDRAIDTFQRVCDRLPATGLIYPGMHMGLANSLAMRHGLGVAEDEQRAVDAYRKAVSSTSAGHTQAVLTAARQWIGWAVGRSAWAEVAEAGEPGLEAAHRLVQVQLNRSHKEDWLRDLQGLPTEIAIARVHLGDPRGAALAIEEGSAILLSEALQRQLRDFDRLVALGLAPLTERYRDATAKLAALTKPVLPGATEIDLPG